ncbi:MAG: hypothetical protein R3314_10115 [Longimicrobiales bacterium]|nr:hypothetical protein [Longimicrobiales bacterium]
MLDRRPRCHYAFGVLNPKERSGQEGQGSGAGGSARDRTRRRSFTFLERDGERWSVFLATYAGGDGRWRGYFTFRTAAAELLGEEIRTADLFVESEEADVDARARGLGRPLLRSLLESALHTRQRRRPSGPDMGGWFRRVLADRSEQLSMPVRGVADPSVQHLETVYDSYRIDQVSHLIALLEPEAFNQLVERLLDGRQIDFRATDRLQAAMLVVQELERHLPLPPFEVWVEDYTAHPETYQRYSHALHREERLPD